MSRRSIELQPARASMEMLVADMNHQDGCHSGCDCLVCGDPATAEGTFSRLDYQTRANGIYKAFRAAAIRTLEAHAKRGGHLGVPDLEIDEIGVSGLVECDGSTTEVTVVPGRVSYAVTTAVGRAVFDVIAGSRGDEVVSSTGDTDPYGNLRIAAGKAQWAAISRS
jgi:hypothetical protein